MALDGESQSLSDVRHGTTIRCMQWYPMSDNAVVTGEEDEVSLVALSIDPSIRWSVITNTSSISSSFIGFSVDGSYDVRKLISSCCSYCASTINRNKFYKHTHTHKKTTFWKARINSHRYWKVTNCYDYLAYNLQYIFRKIKRKRIPLTDFWIRIRLLKIGQAGSSENKMSFMGEYWR